MKQFFLLIAGSLCYLSAMTQPSTFAITTDKTTSLIFPFSILNVDRGTKDILAKQVAAADNILLIKAASKDFPETNLTVVTEDGNIYTFSVNYSQDPDTFVYHLPAVASASLQTYANGIIDNPRILSHTGNGSGKARVQLYGIYTHNNTTFYQLKLINESAIDYDIELMRFFVKDRKTEKRTAIQEVEKTPLYVAGNDKIIRAFQQTMVVVVLERFTIPDQQFLGIQIMEKNGGRHLLMKVSNKKIINAMLLPDIK